MAKTRSPSPQAGRAPRTSPRLDLPVGRARRTIRRPDLQVGRAGRQAQKRFGQHFLEPPWVEKLLHAIAPGPSEVFLEIGAGRGALTRPLAAAAAHVMAFEIDRMLAADLRQAAVPRLSIVEGDFLDTSVVTIQRALSPHVPPAEPSSLALSAEHRVRGVRVVGNLPYNVASPILFKLVDLYVAGLPLTDAVVMLQREVADRLLAAPGRKDYGVLAVMIGHWAHVDRVLSLPPGAFRPVPRVHSSVVRLRFHPAQPPASDERIFRALTQAVFTRRRKTLLNALMAYPPSRLVQPGEVLKRTGIDGRRRPETLDIADFVRLSDVFAAGSAGSEPV